jgi:DNA-binding NtrC family response regulator
MIACFPPVEEDEMTRNAKILVIMPAGSRRAQLMARLKALGAAPVGAENCRQAQQVLAHRHGPNVVISDVAFPDGDWRDTLAQSQRRPKAVGFLVSTPIADHSLWSEVLWRGAYDLLVEPYSTSELRRVVEGALRATGILSPPLGAAAAF